MIAPPCIAEALLEGIGARKEFRDPVIGDLAEEFAIRAERDGVRAARRWYYREAIRATPHLLRDWSRGVRARDVAHLAGVVLTSYVFLVVLGGFIIASARSVLGPLGLFLHFQHVSWRDPRLLWLELALGPLSAVSGGYIAAWLNDRAPLVSALGLGVVWSCGTLAWAMVTGAPIWVRIALPVVLIVGTTAGGILRVRTSRFPVVERAPRPSAERARRR